MPSVAAEDAVGLRRRNGADEWRPGPREQAEQAVARACVILARWFEVASPERRDLERARREIDEALRVWPAEARPWGD